MIRKVVAITGANGFIGRHLCADLWRRGFSVRALTRTPVVALTGAHLYPISDLLDVKSLRPALRGADSLIHLAGRAHVMFDHTVEAYRVINVEGTRSVVTAATAESVKQVIFVSSVKVIGEGGHTPLTDYTPEAPEDAYGRSKLQAEGVLADVCAASGIALTIVRLPLVYGPGVKGNIRRLFDAVWRGVPVPVSKVPNARSMLGIENFLPFVAAVLERPVISDRPYLLSDVETPSTERLLHLIGLGLGRPERVVRLPLELLRVIASAGDALASFGLPIFTTGQLDRLTKSLVVDSSRAWHDVRFEPPVPVATGIQRTAAWYRENHK